MSQNATKFYKSTKKFYDILNQTAPRQLDVADDCRPSRFVGDCGEWWRNFDAGQSRYNVKVTQRSPKEKQKKIINDFNELQLSY